MSIVIAGPIAKSSIHIAMALEEREPHLVASSSAHSGDAAPRRQGTGQAFSVLSDAAVTSAGDLLDYDRYVAPLVQVLINSATETPLTIGVFGEWGSGKSSVLRMLDDRLLTEHRERFVRVHFNAWLHRHEKGMLIPLLHTLHDTLMQDPGERFKEAAGRVLGIAARLAADVLLRKMTAEAASLSTIDDLAAHYARQRRLVESETRNLRKTLESQVAAIHDHGARLVIFIDDLDRCQPEEIIDVLELIKLFFDVKHAFVVLAVDKEVIDRGIQAKYSRFRFVDGRETEIGAEYLEKLVQLPVQLYTLRPASVRTFVERLEPCDTVRGQIALLSELLPPNPRKIKRAVNVLALTLAIASATRGLRNLDTSLLTRLVVLQVRSPDLYCEVVRRPALLAALESVYRTRRDANRRSDFDAFGEDQAEALRTLCERFHAPGTYLSTLFARSEFEAAGSDLPAYVTMLGS